MRVMWLVCRQMEELQGWLDSSFAVSVTVSYNAEKLAEEFGVPVREILRGFRRERQSGRLPGDMVLTSDHRALITLSATVRDLEDPSLRSG